MVVVRINRGEGPQSKADIRYSGMNDRTWPNSVARLNLAYVTASAEDLSFEKSMRRATCRPKATSVCRSRVAPVHPTPDIGPVSAFERPLFIAATACYRPIATAGTIEFSAG